MILVIDNYDSFTYNLVQLLSALGAAVRVERNDVISAEDALALEPTGVVISPGPGTPDDAGISRDVIRMAGERRVPTLGVCLGHQCIAEVFGGRVTRGPEPVHGKTADVHHAGLGVLADVPSPFTATRYHSLVVEPDSVPATLEVTARTDDGIVMALRHRELPLFGVQFHPESVLTPDGVKVLSNFLRVCGELPAEEVQAAAAPPVAPANAESAVPASREAVVSAIRAVVGGEDLSEEAASEVMGAIMDGEATSAQIASLVTAMRVKGETADEITGFARAMRERATAVRPAVSGYIDTCGTGGDGLNTFNISTTTAFVVAGAGVPIAKHGNRAVSSASGSADVLEALGVRIDLSPEDMARCVDEAGVGFLFAQALHSSMRHAAGPRREIAIRTVFNVLGPLTNPAGARRQLLGVYDESLVPILAEVAGRLGAERVLVVHGHPGMDEVSVSGPTTVAEYAEGAVRAFEVTPEQVGIARVPVEQLAGGDAQTNAAITRGVLEGEVGARREVVVLNAAVALLAAEKAADLAEGVARARESIDSGAALAALHALVDVSRRLGERADAKAAAEAKTEGVG